MFRVKPYAAPLLAAIRESGCRTGLVSNTEAVLTRLDLRRSGLRHHFDTVILSSEVGLTKPDPRIFALALHRLQVGPGSAVFVGDDLEADIVDAQEAGLRSLFINLRGLDLPPVAPPIARKSEEPFRSWHRSSADLSASAGTGRITAEGDRQLNQTNTT